VRGEVHELKVNDLALLNAAIEALTFTLMKNGPSPLKTKTTSTAG
jgi:hypothetical protein